MKRSHVGAALSVVVHAVVAAIVAMWPKPHEVVTAAPNKIAAPPVVRVVPSEAIEVEFVALARQVPLAARAPGVEGASASAGRHRASSARMFTIEAPAVPATPAQGEPSRATGPVPSLPSIRESADRLTAAIAPAAIAPAAISRDEAVRPPTTFDIHVAPYGNVHITDRPNLQGGGRDRAVQREVSRDEYWLEVHHERSNALEMKVRPVGATVATFDVTDWAMRGGVRIHTRRQS